MRDITLRSLRIFEAAASASSFSRAAEVLEMTQSAVSQQIRVLEDEVKTKLFDTQARPVQLTDAGRELLRHARSILAQVNIATDSLASLEGQFRGQLHIGAVSPSNYFVPHLMAAFRQRFPDVRMKLTMSKRDTLLAMLAEHRLDVIIGGFPPSETDVEVEAFARHPHCLVAAANHPLASRRGLEWRELSNEPFILREPNSATRRFFEHLLQVQGLQVSINLELEGNETVKQAVMVGLGISFLSAHVFQLELAAGKLAVLDVLDTPKWLDWCILTRREVEIPAVRKAFRDFVITEGAAFTRCETKSP
ncbi:MAG TPA: LysR substrate-binding domain-containing protein [Burkholderiaceae bacterium]|nr:LysR substrate-binding domain-containing protein [Burkholderiaceae bacterium]